MTHRVCIIHYEGLGEYSNVKDVSVINDKRIREAKRLRERAEDISNHHTKQCDSIPDVLDKDKHGIHLEPCYKKFTLIISKSKVHSPTGSDAEKRTSVRISSPTATNSENRWVYPKECNICKKYSVKVQGKKVIPRIITTLDACETVKAAALAKNLDMYNEIKDVDLFAVEFKYHPKCYNDFTLGYSKHYRMKTNDDLQKKSSRDIGDFEAVKECVLIKILRNNEVTSMKTLHALYGLQLDDSRYRSRLKKRLQEAFPNQLTFFQTHNNSAEVVLNTNALNANTGNFFSSSNTDCVIKAAQFLRQEILDYADKLDPLNWPPSAEELSSEKICFPSLLITFLSELIKSKKVNAVRNEKNMRLIDSYASDLVYGVTCGKVLTAKHFLLALGLHNITGQRKVVQINHRLGHCMSYDLTCEIETAQALKAQELAKNSSALPLQPASQNSIVLTYFWVDNFDLNVDSSRGGGSIHTTHLMAFQEADDNSTENQEAVLIERTKKRSLDVPLNEQPLYVVDPKKEPPSLIVDSSSRNDKKETILLHAKYFVWLWLRKQNSFDQNISPLSGWLLKHRISEKLVKTVATYLPPITTKVTDYATIITYMEYLQMLAKSSNMPYVNITLDIGAAINAYKVLWNYTGKFSNVIIHPGDFHFMKENFLVLGNLVSSSGFEDVAFQADICSSGSLLGVLSGSHYNRAWIVHSSISEAMERLLLTRFIREVVPQVPIRLSDASADPDIFSDKILESCQGLAEEYNQFREKVCKGSIGKTAQFWIMYLNMMRNQHCIHTAVQENQFDMRVECWEFFIPFYFALNKINYARYGSFYLQTMKSLDYYRPGLRDLLEVKGMSVQAQDRHPIRTAIDQRGEQTINRDAKTAGGIRAFASENAAVLKWCLNRSEQAHNTKSLLEKCGLNTSSELYKPCRPSQILFSESLVSKVIQTLTEEYINPFDDSIDQSKLFNLSSGIPVLDGLADEILEVQAVGNKLADEFQRDRLQSNNIKFHAPIRKTKYKTFKDTKKTVTICKNKQTKAIAVNRDVIATLLSLSVKTGKVIDFDKALQFPLSPIPLSLCSADGTKRSNAKSQLSHLILDSRSNEISPQTLKEDSVYVVDMVALLRTMTEIPETFECIAWRIVKSIPSGYRRVDIVADSYHENSIKSSERKRRGTSTQIMVKSSKSKVPRNFNEFMSNSNNKIRMIDLIFEVLIDNKVKVLNMLRTTKLIIASDNSCKVLTMSLTNNIDNLVSNQEEADTKVILHSLHALGEDSNVTINLRSPSGDTDIVVLSTVLLHHYRKQVFLDNGSGSSRKYIWLGSISLDTSKIDALIGLHSFTGNDYASSFFRKSKERCWEVMNSDEKFSECFKSMGSSWTMSDNLLAQLEEFTCRIYNYKEKSVNSVRSKMFKRKQAREHKVPDLSSLPPCQASLYLHALRSNTVATIWKNAVVPIVDFPSFEDCGWESNGEIHWINEAFPKDIEDLLFEVEDEQYECGSDGESDDEMD